MKIGFIGLGNMGGPMAQNLLKAGHNVTAFDLSESAIAEAKKHGAQIADSAAAIAQQQPDVIITMLPAAKHVRSVYLGDDGLIAQGASSTLFIDCSTIDPHTARDVAQTAKEQDITIVDAPVSGGTMGASNATLTFMVGGSDAGFNQAKPVLEAMGKNIVHCGDSGNGQVAKVANNMLLSISMIGVAEAMNLGVELGMDPATLAGIINTSSGRCWSSEINNPYPGALDADVPSNRDYSGGFGSALMLKDLGLALEAAQLVEQPVPLGGLAKQMYQQLCNQGHSHLDFSSIIKLIKQDNEK